MSHKYDSFSNEAKEVMVETEGIARKWKHEYVGTETILVALLSAFGVRKNRVERLLRSLGISPGVVVFEACLLVKPGEQPTSGGTIPLTPRAKKVLEYAVEEARNHKRDVIGTEYLLLGLLREQDGVAAQVLMNLNLRFEAVREQILCLDDEDRDSASASSPAPVVTSKKDSLERIADSLDEITPLLRELVAFGKQQEEIMRD